MVLAQISIAQRLKGMSTYIYRTKEKCGSLGCMFYTR
jgi:hypothetical protein